MTIYHVTVEVVPPTLNTLLRLHHMVRSRVVRLVKQATVLALRPVPPLHRARVDVVRYSAGRQPDYDNLVGGCKHVVDALKAAGVIDDDDSSHVRVTYEARRCATGQGWVELAIEPWDGLGG